MIAIGVGTLLPAEFALRLNMLRGKASYAVYLATPDKIQVAMTDLAEELQSFDATAKISVRSPRNASALIFELAADSSEILLVSSSAFSAADWALLDRRRSSITRQGLLIFVTTQSSFDELMRQAPNLASLFGGQVFAYPDEELQRAAHREQRLAALRAWAARSDAEILEAARQGTLSRDPEFAEWLVLLGHSELLASPTS